MCNKSITPTSSWCTVVSNIDEKSHCNPFSAFWDTLLRCLAFRINNAASLCREVEVLATSRSDSEVHVFDCGLGGSISVVEGKRVSVVSLADGKSMMTSLCFL